MQVETPTAPKAMPAYDPEKPLNEQSMEWRRAELQNMIEHCDNSGVQLFRQEKRFRDNFALLQDSIDRDMQIEKEYVLSLSKHKEFGDAGVEKFNSIMDTISPTDMKAHQLFIGSIAASRKENEMLQQAHQAELGRVQSELEMAKQEALQIKQQMEAQSRKRVLPYNYEGNYGDGSRKTAKVAPSFTAPSSSLTPKGSSFEYTSKDRRYEADRQQQQQMDLPVRHAVKADPDENSLLNNGEVLHVKAVQNVTISRLLDSDRQHFVKPSHSNYMQSPDILSLFNDKVMPKFNSLYNSNKGL